MAGAPAGNRNAVKAKLWTLAIMRAVERLYAPDQAMGVASTSRGIDELADRFVALSVAQSEFVRMAFFKEFGDRIEGRVAQAIEPMGDGSALIDPAEATDPKNAYEVARRIATALTQAALRRAHDAAAGNSLPAIASTSVRVTEPIRQEVQQ